MRKALRDISNEPCIDRDVFATLYNSHCKENVPLSASNQSIDTPIRDENPMPILAEENQSEIEAAAQVLCQLRSAFSFNATTVSSAEEKFTCNIDEQVNETLSINENLVPILSEENRSESEAAEIFCELHSAAISNETTVGFEEDNFTCNAIDEQVQETLSNHCIDVASIQSHSRNQSTQTGPIVEHIHESALLRSVKTEAQLTTCTGLNNFKGFYSICAAVEHYQRYRIGKEDSCEVDIEGRVFLTLMKLKLNCSFIFLGLLFNISDTSCSRYFRETLKMLRQVLSNFIMWPTKDSIVRNMPKCFQQYSSTRVILDCTEIPVYRQPCIKCRTQTYSYYYGRHTLKFMVGVTPDGLISFVSDVYGGKASDTFIFEESSIINLCEEEDSIMVDKGFRIENVCAKKSIKLIRPPFKWTDRLTPKECETNSAIARARVHIERVNERIKNFRILHDEVTWNTIEFIDDIVITICALVNLSPPILSDERF